MPPADPGTDEGAALFPRLGPGREFDRIRRILAQGATPADRRAMDEAGVLVGPGDDAAVLSDGLVLSTDLAVEGIHFNLDWITPEEAGARATAAALSDLAAMAATPRGLLVSLAVPAPGSMAEVVMTGVRAMATAHGAPLLGGDLTRSPGPLLLDVVAVGQAGVPLLRGGARPGDELWVTGTLGAAAAAVEAWKAGRRPDPGARARFARPTPRLAESRWLQDVAGATAGLDLSDGLGGDAAHLAAASGVGVVLSGGALLEVSHRGGESSPAAALARALHGGEDYELAVALPPGLERQRVEEFTRRFDLSLTRVGRIVEVPGVFLEPLTGGPPVPLTRGGWDHFAPPSSST